MSDAWDNLDGDTLVCSSNGVPGYQFVCMLVTHILAGFQILNGILSFHLVYLEVRYIMRLHARRYLPTVTTSNTKKNSKSSTSSLVGVRRAILSPRAIRLLVTCVACLSSGLGLALNGFGTSHPSSEFRGQLGDFFGKILGNGWS